MDIQQLVGNPLTDIGRAGDMLWMDIGRPVKITSILTKEEQEVSEFAIHFQCQWRFVQNGAILLASHDIYEPFDSKQLDDETWEWDVFGREKQKSSQFDVAAKELNERILPLRVERLHILRTGDLHIDFDKGVCFDTFITYSRKYEFYRFIDFNTDEHFAIYDE